MTQIAGNSLSYYKDYFYVLSVALIEIRAESDVERAKVLADIFHNIPAKIASGSSIEEIDREISLKAARHGFSKKISAIMEHAKSRR